MNAVKTMGAHPDAVYFLRAQGWISFASAVFLLALIGIILLVRLGKKRIKAADTVWLVLGVITAGFFVFEGFWSFAQQEDPIRYDGASLQVGGKTIAIEADTRAHFAASP